MRSRMAQKMHETVPKEEREFVKLYGNLVLKIHDALKAQGLSQKEFATNLGKKPSEISKWLNGHNLTLRTIAKLQAELGITLLEVPKEKAYKPMAKGKVSKKASKTCNLIPHGDFLKARTGAISKSIETTRNAS